MYPFLNYTAYVHLLCSNCNLRWLFWRNHGLQRKLLLVTSRSLGAFFFNRTQIIRKKRSRVLSQCNVLKHHLDRYRNSAISSEVNTCCWKSDCVQLCGLTKGSVVKVVHTMNTLYYFQCTASTLISEVNQAISLASVVITEIIYGVLHLCWLQSLFRGLSCFNSHHSFMRQALLLFFILQINELKLQKVTCSRSHSG